jgi:hypothetical protein
MHIAAALGRYWLSYGFDGLGRRKYSLARIRDN